MQRPVSLGLIVCATALAVFADTGTFWHVADFHYDPSYTTTGDSCKNRTDTGALGRYGSYMCDSPWLLITEAVSAMKRIRPDVDFVIWTGDDTPHVPDAMLSEDVVVSIITNLTALLNDTFQDTPVYAALGNHDYHPKNQMPPTTNYLYHAVWKHWRHWVKDAQADSTFEKGGYYTVKLTSGLRMVILNTVLYYKSNKVTPLLDDPAGQFKWLDGVLTASKQDNEKVYIVTHIPPGMFEKHVSWYWMPDKFNARIQSLVVKHADAIAGIFYGHHHTDTFRLFYDGDGKPVASGLIAPAVTPWKTTLPNGIGTLDNNPAIRLVTYDKDTFEVKEISQYFLNLTAANLSPDATPNWRLEYNATTAYGLQDLSPASMHQLVESFLADDSETFQKYIDFNSVSHHPGEICKGACKAAQYCAVANVDKELYAKCFLRMTSDPSTTPTSAGNANCISILATVLTTLLICLFQFHG